MATVAISYLSTSYGELILGIYEDQVCLCDWRDRKARIQIDQRIQKALNAEYQELEVPLHRILKEQLTSYFAGSIESFSLPLLMLGTNFQKEIWRLLLEIPYGTILSYLGLAKRYQDEKAIRAVATANGANAISILIPCHRVVGANGELRGYAGGLECKRNLLLLESKNCHEQLELFK